MSQSLYEKYGGFSTIQALVSDFYDRILDDDRVSHFFETIDMTRQIDHQTKFLSTALGGAADLYSGGSLEKSHKDLDISETDFGVVAEILQEVLEDHDLEPEDISLIMGIVSGTKTEIVKKSAA